MEAHNIFQDLKKKYPPSFVVFSGLGVTALSMLQFDEAEDYFLLALERDSKSVETLANLVTCSRNAGKMDVMNRYLGYVHCSNAVLIVRQIQSIAPKHSLLRQGDMLSDLFEQAVNAQ